MALASRRLAALALGTAVAVVTGLAGPLTTASAADPVTSSPAPALIAPADDPAGANELKDVVLQWSPVAHADSYQVQVSPNGDWTNNKVTLPDNGTTVNTVYDMPISLPHAFYYWRVRGMHGSAHTGWSDTRTFLREWYAPFQMLHVPTDTDASLSWQPVRGASLYRVRFSVSPTFNDPKTFTCFTEQTSYSPYATNIAGPERLEAGGCFDSAALTQNTKYYWEVAAYDDSTDSRIVADTANDPKWECGQPQPECDAYWPHESSATPSFTFQAPTADTVSTAPTGLKTTWHAGTATANDCTGSVCPMTPTLSWNPVPGANYYEVHVWRDPRMSNTYRVYDTAYTSVTPREGLFDAQAGTPYYWAVFAGTCENSVSEPYCANSPDTASGVQSPTCPTTTTAAAPAIADGTAGMSASPAGPTGAQSATGGQTPKVTLTGTGFAAGACVQASSDGGVIKNITVVDATHITFDYLAPATTMSVTFTVVNQDGGTSNPSAPLDVFGDASKVKLYAGSALSTFKKRSGTVNLFQPVDGSTTNDAGVTFSWSDFLATGGQGGYDVRNYHLQVATDPAFDNVVWDDPNVDLTQFTNPKTLLPDGTWYWRVQGLDESGNDLTWSAVHSFTKDSTPPALRLAVKSGFAVDRAVTITSSEPVEGLTSSTVRLVPATGGAAVRGTLTRTSHNTWALKPSSVLATGQVYRLSVSGRVHDAAGNAAVVTGTGVRSATAADDRSAAMRFSGPWSRHPSSQAFGGTFSSGTAGHSAKVAVAGKSVSLYACRGPAFGNLSVLVDGHRTATLSEHRSYTTCGVLLWHAKLSSGTQHTIQLVAGGGAGNVDAVRVG